MDKTKNPKWELLRKLLGEKKTELQTKYVDTPKADNAKNIVAILDTVLSLMDEIDRIEKGERK